MKKALLIDAVGMLDTDLLEEYVRKDQNLRSQCIARTKKRKRYFVTLLAAAVAMMLCVALLVTSLPLVYVFNREKINSAVSRGMEQILFPLDTQDQVGGEIKQEDLLINWTEWEITKVLFQVLGAGTEDSVIEQMQAMQGGFMSTLGDWLMRMYEYYLKYKDQVELPPDEPETETETETESETEPEIDPGYEVDGSKGLKYRALQDGESYAVIGIGTCTDKIIIIPKTYEGKPVTEIGEEAFQGADIEEVHIPEGISVIGREAFRDCAKLDRIMLPEGLLSIGQQAFMNCFMLESIQIPNSVTSLDHELFMGCIFLKEVTFSPNLQSIGVRTFKNCRELTAFTIPESCTDLGGEIFVASGVVQVEILAPITVLPAAMFEACNVLYSVSLPDTLEHIKESAFDGCLALRNIDLPDSVHTIENDAFRNCKSLVSADLPSGLVMLGERAFSKCSSLKLVCIPKGVATIEKYTFDECSYLEEVVFEDGDPETVEYRTIREHAFSGCMKLQVLVLPNDLKIMEVNAFKECSSLVELTIPGSLESIPTSAFIDCTSLKTLVLEEGVQIIGGSAFYGCTSLEQLEMSSTVKSIGKSAFFLCQSLKSVTIGKNIISIGNDAFNSCVSLTDVHFAENSKLETVGNNAFEYCNSLTYIAFPESVRTIGTRLFQNCDNIREVVFPERIEEIPEYTFAYSGVVNYVVPAGIEKIETYAFYEAKQLESVTLPVSVKSIGKSAFRGCDSLTHIYYEGTLAEWREVSFAGMNNINITVVCSDGETIA